MSWREPGILVLLMGPGILGVHFGEIPWVCGRDIPGGNMALVKMHCSKGGAGLINRYSERATGMERSAHLKRVQELYDSGKVRGEVYDTMLMNVDVFCDDGGGTEDGSPQNVYEKVGYCNFDNS